MIDLDGEISLPCEVQEKEKNKINLVWGQVIGLDTRSPFQFECRGKTALC